MATRIQVLESQMQSVIGRLDRVEDKLGDISVTLARIEGKLDAKVDWKWALGLTVAVLLVVLRAEILATLTQSAP